MRNNTAIEPLETRIAPATVFGVTDNNGLFSFDSATPGTVTATVPITGLGMGELIKAMDFRPATGGLYGIAISGAGTFTGRLYLIEPTSGAAAPVGAAFSTTLTSGLGYDMDFDPADDLIRMVNLNEQNLRLNPNDGTIKGTDTNITGATSLAAIAYSNNYPGATSTTLYAVDYNFDHLVTIGGLNANPASPNGGVATKIGNINVTTDPSALDRLGLDILTTLEGNTAFYTGKFNNEHRLYTLNLTTAAVTLVGAIGNGTTPVFDIAVQPAAFTFTAGKSFTYTDGDGDLVTVKTSAGTLNPAQFGWLASADGTRRELTQMNIAGDVAFAKANLTFTAKKTATGGDGRVDVASIDATGINLGAVKIGGNLEQIQVGTNDAVIPAMKSFAALSMGLAFGGTDAPSVFSQIDGSVPLFKIAGDLNGVGILVTKAGTVTIGGSIIGGSIIGGGNLLTGGFTTSGGAKSFTLGGSIIAGTAENTGFLNLSGKSGTVKIGGSIIGGPAFSGSVDVDATSLTIGGSVVGGTGQISGTITATVSKAFTVGGSVIGGNGDGSGRVSISGNATTAKILGDVVGGNFVSAGSAAFSTKGSLLIGGSIVGGTEQSTGTVFAAASVASVKIGGSIIGGEGANSGGLDSAAPKSVAVGGSVVGGKGTFSATLEVNSPQELKIGGSIVGGDGSSAGIVLAENPVKTTIGGSIITTDGAGRMEALNVGSLTIAGSVVTVKASVNSDSSLEFVTAKSVTINGSVEGSALAFIGKAAPASIAESIAIGTLTIKGSVTNTQILIGGERASNFTNVNAAAGTITIGRDFLASSISAGFEFGMDGLYGNADDVAGAMGTLPDIKASIGSIIIKGRANGTGSEGDHYGIVAESLGTVSIGGRKLALTAAAQDNILTGIHGDFRIRENVIA